MQSLTVCSPKLLCHVLPSCYRPRLKHPLDMRMPLLFDDGPPSSNPSQNSPSGDSRSSIFGDLAAPTSQGVPAEAWRTTQAGSRDRALWGSEALLEAPELQNAQQLVGESICSLQVGKRDCIKQVVKLLCWGEHPQPAVAGLPASDVWQRRRQPALPACLMPQSPHHSISGASLWGVVPELRCKHGNLCAWHVCVQERSRQMGFAGCHLQSTDSLATEQYTTWLKNLKRSVKSAMSLKAKVGPSNLPFSTCVEV